MELIILDEKVQVHMLGAYTIGFLMFWALGCLSSWITTFLLQKYGKTMDTRVVMRRDNLEISEDLIRRFDSWGPRYMLPIRPRIVFMSVLMQILTFVICKNVMLMQRPPCRSYIHVPFASLCYYCACNKVITKIEVSLRFILRILRKN